MNKYINMGAKLARDELTEFILLIYLTGLKDAWLVGEASFQDV